MMLTIALDRSAGTSFELPLRLDSAALTRRHIRSLTAGVESGVVEDALLLATELVTNAVRFGRAPVVLTVGLDATRLWVSVTDNNPVLPPPAPSAHAPVQQVGGRGLAIIAALASRWGAARTPDGSGKSVWFQLELVHEVGATTFDDVEIIAARRPA
jgi:anti-sigma regulatory factor (Ser/Thr protein kinase)